MNDHEAKYHIYPFGLSNQSKFISIDESAFAEGQGLSLTGSQHSTSSRNYKLTVRDVADILFEFKVLTKEASSIMGELSLLHVNCEGCEYDVIDRLLSIGLISHVRHLQFGSHRPTHMQSTVVKRYCSLQASLNESHCQIFGVPWGWERWTNPKLAILK
jgi:hypothetical protein